VVTGKVRPDERPLTVGPELSEKIVKWLVSFGSYYVAPGAKLVETQDSEIGKKCRTIHRNLWNVVEVSGVAVGVDHVDDVGVRGSEASTCQPNKYINLGV
jgi:hypothetical protein